MESEEKCGCGSGLDDGGTDGATCCLRCAESAVYAALPLLDATDGEREEIKALVHGEWTGDGFRHGAKAVAEGMLAQIRDVALDPPWGRGDGEPE